MKINSLSELNSVRTYMQRIGAEERSMRTAVVREISGNYWKDVAVIRFSKTGDVEAPEKYRPTEVEAASIKTEFAQIEWPTLEAQAVTTSLPDDIKDADPGDVFWFRDPEGLLLMVQVRKKARDGGKAYIPWTYWSDGRWRKMEPEGNLPLWGMEHIKNNTTVFIHEGAKAARAMHEMINAKDPETKDKLREHPWGEELSNAAHLGWIGGAMSPHRTDWSALRRMGIKKAYIVSDNDPAGLSAVPAISYHLNVPTFHLQFTSEWPASFDLADEFPDHMFKEIDGQRHYVGPAFMNCLHPATWATDQIPNKKGKPTTVLRDHFKEMWAYVEEADMYVCIAMPEIIRSEMVLNKMLSGFSHTNNTCQLIVKAYTGRSTKFCYRPDIKGRMVTDRTTAAVNLHTPTRIKSRRGDDSQWLRFMDYLIVDERERHEMLRWCATLIARPDIRMEYGTLMVSEHQGIGKTTLGSQILAPLVGHQNVGTPTENDIVNSDFNEWLANKRLVIVNEIYSGHSWKAYNRLKSYITDREVTVNQKYQRPYLVENWAHVFACSNSLRALRMEEDDRRWFYPTLTEVSWSREKFTQLHMWLKSGGLSLIKSWAERWEDYVLPGQRAPMTERKRELINESRSEAQKECASLANTITELDQPIVLAMKEIEGWVRSSVQGKVFDSDYELRKAMKECGAIIYPRRVKLGGRLQYVVMNKAAFSIVERTDQDTHTEQMKQWVTNPNKLLEAEM